MTLKSPFSNFDFVCFLTLLATSIFSLVHPVVMRCPLGLLFQFDLSTTNYVYVYGCILPKAGSKEAGLLQYRRVKSGQVKKDGLLETSYTYLTNIFPMEQVQVVHS